MGSFSSAPQPSGVTEAPLPPLPSMQSSPGGAPPEQGGLMASLMSGIAPVKMNVDQILAACKQIVQTGVIPGAEQVCGQIVALATSLLPMAAQAAMQPTMGMGGPAGPGGPGAGMAGMPMPPGPPPGLGA